MRHLIINADGYGFTAGITRAIEECIKFGTVRSLSANVNFKHADGLADLVRAHPDLSVGCHLNPIVGRPILPSWKVLSLVDENGDFFYQTFTERLAAGQIRLTELKAEMTAQVDKTRDLVGRGFSHIDFHMGLHRLPALYPVFLDVVRKSGVGRIRTHRYRIGIEHRFPRVRQFLHLFERPKRIPKDLWNLWLRQRALNQRLTMPDRNLIITHMGLRPDTLTTRNYLMMLRNLPPGFSEFIVHPGYVDNELRRWSTYIDQRNEERQVLLSPVFRDALLSSDIHLAGYRDIPLNHLLRSDHEQ